MTLPQRTTLPEHKKGRLSFLPYVPNRVILTKIADHLRDPEYTSPPRVEVP